MSYQAILTRLQGLVEMVLFGQRDLRATARDLADRHPDEQQRFIHSVELISRNSCELAYLFCQFAPPALDTLSDEAWQHWAPYLIDRYDNHGVRAATDAMQAVEAFAHRQQQHRHSVDFASAVRLLDPFVTGLDGRPLKLVANPKLCYTDTQTLHLPPQITHFADRALNQHLYQAIAVHLWAQGWFGSWRHSLSHAAARFTDPQRAIALFHALERIRLDACIARELPGLARRMQALRDIDRRTPGDTAPDLDQWHQANAALNHPEASVNDSYDWLKRVYPLEIEPPTCCYQGSLQPHLTEPVVQARQTEQRAQLGLALREILDHQGRGTSRDAADTDPPPAEFALRRADRGDEPQIELSLDGQVIPIDPATRQLINAVTQDLGEVPPDFLQAADADGDGDAPALPASDTGETGAECRHRYDEWDHLHGHYRKDWCDLTEHEVTPQYDDFAATTLQQHRGHIRQLRRSFEALRGQDRRLRKQPNGDEVDLDAVIDSLADQAAGLEASDQLFVRHQHIDRDIAVLFMVDMSGSTRGWINQTEREALILLCESLQTLGDRYAVFGFTSDTRKHCEVLRIKRFDEDYGDEVKARISGIAAQKYTRMGAAIRHLSRHLQTIDARTRLLITLSDGRPDDSDGYRGSYGIEDTRQAVIEARAVGIHPFCITIDEHGMDYLPHLFGPNGYTVVDHIERLPLKLPDIYRRLTI